MLRLTYVCASRIMPARSLGSEARPRTLLSIDALAARGKSFPAKLPRKPAFGAGVALRWRLVCFDRLEREPAL